MSSLSFVQAVMLQVFHVGLVYELMWSCITAVTEQDKMSFMCYLKRYHSITVSGYTDDVNRSVFNYSV